MGCSLLNGGLRFGRCVVSNSGLMYLGYLNLKIKVMVISSKAGVPKRDGSGKGNRANAGRGGCAVPRGGGKMCRGGRVKRSGRRGNR